MADGISIKQNGALSLAAHFQDLPENLKQALARRLGPAFSSLRAAIEAGEPRKTGRLRASTQTKIYIDRDSVKANVFVYNPALPPGAYAGYAALEWGRTGKSRKRKLRLRETLAARMASRPLLARAYLRRPFEAFKSTLLAEMNEALAETVTQVKASGE